VKWHRGAFDPIAAVGHTDRAEDEAPSSLAGLQHNHHLDRGVILNAQVVLNRDGFDLGHGVRFAARLMLFCCLKTG